MIMSDFQMQDYCIKKLTYEYIPSLTENAQVPLEYYAHTTHECREGAFHGNVSLGFRATLKEQSMKDLAHDITLYEVVIQGSFSMPAADQPDAEKRFVEMMKVNGAASLIPIARAALVSASSVMHIPKAFYLPNINVFELAWKESVPASPI